VSVLELRDVTAAPWGRPLLAGIDLSLDAGEVLGIAGPNGAGKSSLLKTITGEIPLDSGEVLLGGRPQGTISRAERARQLACLPQLSLLNFPYTVDEVVSLGRIPHDTGLAVDASVAREVMQATDTLSLADPLYTQLSGGERQRVQLARILAQVWGPGSPHERLLLLDEPTSALDLAHQQLLAATVRRLADDGCAVVLVIHDLNLMAGLADRVAIIARGRLTSEGRPGEVLTEALFRDVFGVEVTVGLHPDLQQPVIVNRR
jgi:iron complex transport system ATP-binding protein